MSVFHWPIRVYYEDTDAGGVVFHANYLKFCERARTEMLRQFGFEQDQMRIEQNIIFAVKSAQLDYLKPARFNQCLDVSVAITHAKKVSLYFTHIISLDDVMLCKVSVHIVCLRYDTLTLKKIPDFILHKLTP